MNRITPEHLARGAYVYVRQSTADQLNNNPESRRRQYALEMRAKSLGWEKSSSLMTISASQAAGKPDLASNVCLRRFALVVRRRLFFWGERSDSQPHMRARISAPSPGTRELPAGEPRKTSPRHSRRRTRVGIQEAGLGTCRSGALTECEPGTQRYDALATFLSKSTLRFKARTRPSIPSRWR